MSQHAILITVSFTIFSQNLHNKPVHGCTDIIILERRDALPLADETLST